MDPTALQMPVVAAESVDISLYFDVLSLSELQDRSFEGSEMEGNEKPVKANSPGGSGVCVKGSLQFCRNYSYAGR